MATSFSQYDLRFRKNFASLPQVIQIPELIQLQKNSYEMFLQKDVSPDKRKDIGLQGTFKNVFPITDFNKVASMEFIDYKLERPKYTVEECRQRGMTFAAPIKVTIRLIIWDVSDEDGSQSIRDIKEQEVYFGELPLMTDNGTFIINGTERVVVSQLHRSPGAFFEHDKGKTHSSGKLLYSARIIPYRGSWIDFEFDHKDLLYVRIDRRRKMHATILLRALGFSTQELIDYFYDTETVFVKGGAGFAKSVELDLLQGQRATKDITHPESGDIIVRKNHKFTKAVIRKLSAAALKEIPINADELIEKVFAHDIVNPTTGLVIAECNDIITEEHLARLADAGVEEFQILFFDKLSVGSYLRDTLEVDKIESSEEAILEIYRRMRPGEPSTLSQARTYFNNLFFNKSRYDLSAVGRLKMNYKFRLNEPLDQTVLTKQDILEVVNYLITLKNTNGVIDDIDHLGNRRVRAVGELLENQYRIGLVRMERAIKERMTMSQELDTLMPHDLINAKPVNAIVKEYFGSSQLSQFMDQTNPLSEITHKRRLSALGPGGLTRDRAGFEVRDVHGTHYGRICPIETPEGPNIGLIASLSTFARVNEFGFIETPYRTVNEGKAKKEVKYYSAMEEEGFTIAHANAPIKSNGAFVEEMVAAHKNGEPVLVRPEDLQLMDVSPNQLVSVAAALIPFLENDDANRALMGSNMQRQAVPLIKTASPLIGTGMERLVAQDSGAPVVAKNSGVVENVDASRIVVRTEPAKDSLMARPDIYHMIKYQRSNQNTCVNQKPIVVKGDVVKKGDIIADGPATESGELALGQNIIIAFMPWGGYNFEDAILVSEELIKEDTFTSIHIEEFECVARDTKLGKEEITRDIPNVGEEALKDLDVAGIIRLGAEVKPGDILVGKVTPKGETQLSPEEKLLRAIFGEKAGDVRDSSLRVPTGVEGTVIDAKIFSRKGVEKDERTAEIEETETARLSKTRDEQMTIIRESAMRNIRTLLLGKKTSSKLLDERGEIILHQGTTLTEKLLDRLPVVRLRQIRVEKGGKVDKQISQLLDQLEEEMEAIKENYEDRIEKLQRGDELPPGVIKIVKVYVAIKRKLQVGDKMAGRHGNKGVISRIMPEEDMPYLPDGTPVQIVLNPLGVPSRMNVGQILETHLGWAAMGIGKSVQKYLDERWSASKMRGYLKKIYTGNHQKKALDEMSDDDVIRFARNIVRGIHVATPVFDGANEGDIQKLMEMCEGNVGWQTVLFDGKTGDPFDHEVTVGVMYILKLHHLVDDKIHARSIGPYSLVTQQPLGGKAQFGGQRLGEMEVWAMEAYGAAYALQEFLTVKSDDVAGRTRMYEAIVKGENVLEAGLPESFNVLVKELKSLALDMELIENLEERD